VVEEPEDESFPVKLYVYDLSQGMARTMAPSFVGIDIEAIYHTSIVIYGLEYFFSRGITYCVPGYSHYGTPIEVIEFDKTFISQDIFSEYLGEISSIYSASTYNLFHNNCNHFTNDLVQFLTGKELPKKILDLPKRVLSTPMGQFFANLL
ncbi:C97 family peptidase, partial [Ascoidea rubescens DSM 1968]